MDNNYRLRPVIFKELLIVPKIRFPFSIEQKNRFGKDKGGTYVGIDEVGAVAQVCYTADRTVCRWVMR
jgi:hypothetical protein